MALSSAPDLSIREAAYGHDDFGFFEREERPGISAGSERKVKG